MTELIWEGKYKDGKRVAPLRVALPFQTVEIVNESAQERQKSLQLFHEGKPAEWRNRLIWGDKKYVLPSLLPEFAGKVNLIYIDPPFNVGADFSFQATIPPADEDDDETLAFTKEPSLIEQKAYRDTWGRGLDSYLQWFYETAVLLHELLAEDGSIYVHLDAHVGHYAKIVLDEVFGKDCFQREIVWRIGWVSGYKTAVKNWIRNHDTILFYTKHPSQFVFNKSYIPYPPGYERRGGGLPTGEGIPIEDVWGLYHEEGLTSVQIMSFSGEKTGYPTQKPEALLERIIRASTREPSGSYEPDLVLDCFCVRRGTGVLVVSPPCSPPAGGGTAAAPSPLAGRVGVGAEAIPPCSPPAGGGTTAPSPLAGRAGVGVLPIEQIQPGQYVIGHDGKPHRVLRTFRREYHGRMVGLKHALCEQTLWLTEDHLVLAKLRPRTLGGNRDWSATPIENRDRRRELRREMTPTEKRLWARLRHNQLGWKFRRQHSIGPFIVDFYCREAQLVIEIDGDTHFTPEAQAYDADRDAYMRSLGLEVLRFTAVEIRQQLDAVLTLIEHRCRQRVDSMEGAQWVPAGELLPGDRVFFGAERCAVPLEQVEHQWTREEVYDIEVEDAHSFLTEVCAVHNCGSGTTAVVAEKLGRRWIACDLSRFAIHTTRKRLLQIPNLRPFVVQNLGKYERQVWQMGAFGDGQGPTEAAARQQAYIQFILNLYHARPISGYTWLHGVKGGRMVHVGSVDAPVSLGDVQHIVAEFRKAVGAGENAPTTNGIDILGWDFAFELNEVARQHADAAKVNLRFLRIPRDVMDKRAVEQGDIQFFELAALQAEVQVNKRKVTVKLTDFVIPPDDVPEDARRAVKHWSQWIDYWAIDWDFRGDAFHNQWQSYRTRRHKQLELQASHQYEQAGDYTILVKVIDILGNDTTKALRVQVR